MTNARHPTYTASGEVPAGDRTRRLTSLHVACFALMAVLITGVCVLFVPAAVGVEAESLSGRFLQNLDLLALACCTAAAVAFVVVWSVRLGVGLQTAVVTAVLMTVVLVFGSWLVVLKGQGSTRNLRRTLEGIAPTYAAEMRARGHWRLPSDAAPDDPLYLELIEAEKRWLAANPGVADVYTFRRDSEMRWQLIVDSETDYNRNGHFDGEREQRTEIGEYYDQTHDELNEALTGRRVFIDRPETDRWGTWVSAFVPVYNDSGNVEAVLGVDFPAQEWAAAIARSRLNVIAYIAVILTTLAAASLLQIGYLRHMNDIARTGQILRAQAAILDEQNGVLEQRTVELAAAKSAADDASRAKSDFLANMSHEIRTPMTAILGYADLLRDGGVSEQERQNYVHIVRRNGQHLLELINEILDLSKIEAGKLTIHRAPMRLESVVAEVESTMRVRAAEKGLDMKIDLNVPTPFAVDTDAFRLRQILVNLVGNAIKFTEKGSVRLVVRSEADPERGEMVVIDVIDTGVGMTGEQVARLFRPFTQADASTTRKYGGTGLGLVISRRLAEMLDGELTVRSESGQGSVFSVRFPRGSVSPEAAAAAGLDDRSAAGQDSQALPTLSGRVLLAEDGPDNRRLICTFLGRAGAQVQVAENGRIACDAVLEAQQAGTPFDLILMDMQMPELDGYDATRRLREHGVTTPIVALTAHAMDADRTKCLNAGCDDYATKPVDRPALLRTCDKWLTSARAGSQPMHRSEISV